jgi:superfamily II DNA helicase RecQ
MIIKYELSQPFIIEVFTMTDNILKSTDVEIQRLINRAVLLVVNQLEEKDLSFGKNRIGSVLKGHKNKYILDNKLDTLEAYGVLEGVDFKLIMNSIEKLIVHGYILEKCSDPSNSKFADDMGMIIIITDKGRVKLGTIVSSQPVKQDYTNKKCEKQKPDHSILEIVNILRSESESCNQIFKSKRRYNILHLYFGRLSTMEVAGKLHGITRERIRQIIKKEIMRINRFPTVRNELSIIDSLLDKNPRMNNRDSLVQLYKKDEFENGEIPVFLRVINYMLKTKGYNVFRE